MNILLTALNAKYHHSCLALRCLKSFCGMYRSCMQILEFTINEQPFHILSSIFAQKPDMVCFSCSVWNVDITFSVIRRLKQVLPDVIVVLGGPEVSFNAEEALRRCPADVVVRGEGEVAFLALLRYYVDGKGSLSDIPGLCFRDKDGNFISDGRSTLSLPFSALPFPYSDGLAGLEHKIIYFESSRGCPFSCAYCLSGAEGGLRFLSLPRCFEALDVFLDAKVRQVKFVDRTFNCNKAHALGIWEHLAARDNGFTNFHFELAGDLIDADTLRVLAKARKGLFQFEIGVQSANHETLAAITRKTDLARLFENVTAVKKLGNIHVHLDLIAGLPHEDYETFGNSFNEVFVLRPDMLQMGFLKLLHGTALRENADARGIQFCAEAPYEILSTADLPFQDVVRLKNIEELLEIVYNSYKCKNACDYGTEFFSSSFAFFETLADFWAAKRDIRAGIKKEALYETMADFFEKHLPGDALTAALDLLRFDMLLCDRAFNRPEWHTVEMTPEEADQGKAAVKARLLNLGGRFNRQLYVEKFSRDFLSWLENHDKPIKKKATLLLFDYTLGQSGAQFERVR